MQHLNALLGLEDFEELWLHLLDFLDRYMHADNSELLMEAVPESLKNMLLVMSTAGVFFPGGSLWSTTWSRIGHFLPSLHKELFPSSVEVQEEGRDLSSAASAMADTAAPCGVVTPATASNLSEAPNADASNLPQPSDERPLHPHPIIV